MCWRFGIYVRKKRLKKTTQVRGRKNGNMSKREERMEKSRKNDKKIEGS
jgi:hypothetical protein